MDWLFQSQPLSTKKGESRLLHQDAIVIAHNFKGYDGQFILNYFMHTACISPSMIMNGTKILSMRACGLKFLDSYNYLPFALSKMPSAFGFQELKKDIFPTFSIRIKINTMWDPIPPPLTTIPLTRRLLCVKPLISGTSNRKANCLIFKRNF